ncbi:hypothetical protein SEPCBS119000_003243 [Sporothrix epigloea]|uniref:AMP-activated protein kinase glycogen-binding domain-containing protein n=1 Tax=Sporothrix epigloea TaxID=1892477 RepID=A0ABP0DKS8_9PEZI
MAKNDIAVDITYTSTDLQPPLWVAGTFSNPPWMPVEMLHRTADNTSKETVFYKTIHVKPGTTVQYKFRVGSGDWWVLDESQPIAIDEMGNRNNLLKVEDKSVKGQSPPTPPPDSPIAQSATTTMVPNLQVPGGAPRSNASTPGFVRTTMEVADTAARIDAGTPQSSASKPENLPDSFIDHLDLAIGPELTHERPGDPDDGPDGGPVFEYEFAGTYDRPPSTAASEASPLSQAVLDDDSDFDPADPTLERFPSRREEILRKVRTLETGLDEDVTTFEGYPASPVVSTRRKSSLGQADAVIDPLPLTPVSPRQTASRQLDSRRDSLVRDHSPSSLQCIPEETNPDDRQGRPHSETNDTGYTPQESASAAIRATEDRNIKTADETDSLTERHPGAFPQSDDNDAALGPATAPQSRDDTRTAEHQELAETDNAKGIETGEYYTRLMAFTRFVFVDWLWGFFGNLFRRRRE